jgi:2,3-bisphosphoglycerate-dependent phosphoglycerate mutase
MTETPVEAVRAHSAIDRAFLTGDPDAGELILVRHGEQDYPPAGTQDFSRYVDPPLSPRGERQAQAVAAALAGRLVASLYSSRLRRAHDTGAAIAAHHGLGVTVVDALREIEMFRDLPKGQSPAEAYGPDALREALEAFVATRRWTAYPGTETGEELTHRVVPAIEAILEAHPRQVVVVACHGGVINAYLVHVLGLTGEDMFFRPAHASTHRLAFARSRRVVGSLNEVHHLAPVDDLLSW